eukprot:m.88191 g.88191  ORF g.88191 m.88191 type:complete len:1902 (+) comp19970_c0_seq4:330-6035(+)
MAAAAPEPLMVSEAFNAMYEWLPKNLPAYKLVDTAYDGNCGFLATAITQDATPGFEDRADELRKQLADRLSTDREAYFRRYSKPDGELLVLMAKHSVMDGSVVDVIAPVDEFITNIRRNGWWIHTDVELQALSDVTSREIHVYKIERGPHGNVLIVNPGDTTKFKPRAAAAATAAEEAEPLRLVLAVGMHYGALLTEDKIATAGLHEYVPQATLTRVADVDSVRWQNDIATKRQTDARERGDQDEARRLGWVLVDLDAILSAILENQPSRPPRPPPSAFDSVDFDSVPEQKNIPKHLFINNEKSTKAVWEVTLLEMKFWAMLEALQDPTVFTTACKSTRYDRPVDFYTMREKIRRFGYNAVNGKDIAVTGREGLDAYFAQLNPATGRRMDCKGVHLEKLWKAMRTKDVEKPGSSRPNNTAHHWRLEKLYEAVIVPFEKAYSFHPLPAPSVTSPGSFRPLCAVGEGGDMAVPAGTESIEEVRTGVRQCLQELQDDILPDLERRQDDVAVGTSITVLQRGITALLETAEASIECWSDLPTVAIIGKAGVGKSHLLNIIIAVCEVPEIAYNPGGAAIEWHSARPPCAIDAGRIAALLICRDINAIPGGGLDPDFEEIQNNVMTIKGVPKEQRDTRRVYETEDGRVLHELPSGAPREGIDPSTPNFIFNAAGCLNPDFEDVGSDSKPLSYGKRRRALVDESEDAFRAYLTGSDRTVDGEFVLPCSDDDDSVTSFSTFIHGGSQYAFVVKYVSMLHLFSKIKAVEKFEREGVADEDRRKEVLHQAFRINTGLQDLRKDKSESANDDKMNNWADKWAMNDKWADEAKRCLNSPHDTTKIYFNKIWIHQGAGASVVDDRVYIKTRLDALLACPVAGLIEELHVIVPSSLLEPATGGAIVDTCGLEDNDIFKINQTDRTIRAATGIVAVSDAALTRGNDCVLGVLKDTDELNRLVVDHLREKRHNLLFVFNPEKSQPSKRPRAVPKSDPKSVLGGDNDCKITEGLKKVTDITENELTKAVVELARQNGGMIDGQHCRPDHEWVREYVTKPMVEQSVHRVFPSLHRAIDVADTLSDDERSTYARATGLGEVIVKIKAMLQPGGVLGSKAAEPIVAQVTTLTAHASFRPKPERPIPPGVRQAAEKIAKESFQRGPELLEKCRDTLKTQLEGTAAAAAARDVARESAWVTSFAAALKNICVTSMPTSWNVLSRKRTTSTTKFNAGQEFGEALLRVKAGTLLGTENNRADTTRLATALFSNCKANEALSEDVLWDSVLQPSIKAAFDRLLEDAFAVFILEHPTLREAIEKEKAFSEGDLRSMLLTQHAGDNPVLVDSFELETRLRKLRGNADKLTGKWSTFKTFRKADTMFLRVLNALFKHIVDTDPAKPRFFNPDLMTASELAATLGRLFTEENFEKAQVTEFLEKTLHDEIHKLFTKVVSWLKQEVTGERTSVKNSRSMVVKNAFAKISKTPYVYRSSSTLAQQDDLQTRYGAVLRRLDAALQKLKYAEYIEVSQAGLRRQFGRSEHTLPGVRTERLTRWFKERLGGRRPEATLQKRDVDSDVFSKLHELEAVEPLDATALNTKFPGVKTSDVRVPYAGCPGKLQLFALLRYTLDDACDNDTPDAHSAALETQRFLHFLFCETKPENPAPIRGAIEAFRRLYRANVLVIVHSGSGAKDNQVLQFECPRDELGPLSTVTVRLLFDQTTGALCLIVPPQKRGRVQTPDCEPEIHHYEVEDIEKKEKKETIAAITAGRHEAREAVRVLPRRPPGPGRSANPDVQGIASKKERVKRNPKSRRIDQQPGHAVGRRSPSPQPAALLIRTRSGSGECDSKRARFDANPRRMQSRGAVPSRDRLVVPEGSGLEVRTSKSGGMEYIFDQKRGKSFWSLEDWEKHVAGYSSRSPSSRTPPR